MEDTKRDDAKRAAAKHVEAFNAHDATALTANEAPDIEFEAPGVKLRGRQQVAEFFATYWLAFPDAKVTVRNQVIDGLTVVSENLLIGIHSGPLRTPNGDIAPTGRRVESRGIVVQRVQAGLVASEHLYFDQLEMLGQLGVLPEPARA